MIRSVTFQYPPRAGPGPLYLIVLSQLHAIQDTTGVPEFLQITKGQNSICVTTDCMETLNKLHKALAASS